MKTTLNQIREHHPCGIRPNADGSLSGLLKLMAYLGKTKTDSEPVSIIQILDSNGLDDALWCLRAVKGYDKEIRLYAVWCARQVEHLMEFECSKQALVVAERYANGQATDEELTAAREEAWLIAWGQAGYAAWAVTEFSAKVAAWKTARETVEIADWAWDAQEKRLRELCAEIEKREEENV